MEVTIELIERLANLSRLAFTDDEKNALKKDLQRMISFVEKLNEVDTAGVEPLLHMSNETNVFRDDEVKDQLTREQGLLNAENKDEQFFKVPKVIWK